MVGGYLRTNFKRTGQNSILALGGGYTLTSYAGGAGLTQPFGGLIMGSVNMSGASVLTVGAQSAMSAWFGNTWDSGYKIKVVGYMIRIFPALAPNGLVVSNEGTSNIAFYPVNSAGLALGSSISAVFEWTGFIVSAPT